MTHRNSVDHATMRDMNLALALETIRINAPLSRAALASMTGLNKATVSSLVRDLLKAGWVREVGTVNSSSEVGRPAINLELNPEAGYMIGAEIGVHFISIAITNFNFEIVSRRYESTDRLIAEEDILTRLVYLLQESSDQVERSGKLLFGIGLGVPGLVDVAAGRLLVAPNLGWKEVALGQVLEERFDAPIFIGNEANLAALGESYFGAGQDINYMIYVSSGVGIGGGIVANGRLMEGSSGFAGEVGHLTIDPDGPACNCGNWGCWETLAGEEALLERVRLAMVERPDSWIAKTSAGDPQRVTLELVVKAADEGDFIALEALKETADWLGIGIASLMNVLNPERVVFGGPLSIAHQYLLPEIQRTVQKRAWSWVEKQANIVTAKYREDAAVIGGSAMVYRELLNQPRKWLRRTRIAANQS